MGRKRDLSAEERKLWQEVTRLVRPAASGARNRGATDALPKPPPLPAKVPALSAPLPSRLGQGAGQTTPKVRFNPAPSLPESLCNAPMRMDAGTFGKMRRGKLVPEARIDLHGMTLAQAHPELIRFVLGAQARGMRLVLVITGKGRAADDQPSAMPQRVGALRHQLPLWLRGAPLGGVVLQVVQAHQRHGGAGAFYVYLRKGR